MRYAALAIAVLSLSGCATAIQGMTQAVSIATSEPGARCTVDNASGHWSLTTPGSVTVHKSRSPLVVACTRAGYVDGSQRVSPKASAVNGAIGLGLAGGLIGGIVDASTGAAWEYPKAVTVKMERAP